MSFLSFMKYFSCLKYFLRWKMLVNDITSVILLMGNSFRASKTQCEMISDEMFSIFSRKLFYEKYSTHLSETSNKVVGQIRSEIGETSVWSQGPHCHIRGGTANINLQIHKINTYIGFIQNYCLLPGWKPAYWKSPEKTISPWIDHQLSVWPLNIVKVFKALFWKI